ERLDDVRMSNARGDASLRQEHPLEIGVVAKLGEHGLERHDLRKSVGSVVARRPHRRHAASPHPREQLVAAQRISCSDAILFHHAPPSSRGGTESVGIAANAQPLTRTGPCSFECRRAKGPAFLCLGEFVRITLFLHTSETKSLAQKAAEPPVEER